MALLTGQHLERVWGRLCLFQHFFARSFAPPFFTVTPTGPSYYHDAKRSALCCPRRCRSWCERCRRPACLQGICPYAHVHEHAFTLLSRRRKSPPRSSNNSLMTGLNAGRLLRRPKRHPLAARPFPTLASGRSRTLRHLSSLARRDSSQSPRLHTTPFLPLLHPLLTLGKSPSWSNTRCSTKRVETAVVVTSNCSRMASRRAGRSFLTLLPG